MLSNYVGPEKAGREELTEVKLGRWQEISGRLLWFKQENARVLLGLSTAFGDVMLKVPYRKEVEAGLLASINDLIGETVTVLRTNITQVSYIMKPRDAVMRDGHE